jgi:hypothetical protein
LVAQDTTECEAKRQAFATVAEQASGYCRMPDMGKKYWFQLTIYGSVFLISILALANTFL